MTDVDTGQPPQQGELPPPMQRYPQLEVDAFCTGCGYNLHSQPVTRDARLGIFVCRCPECGQHHPAGIGVTAASVWLTRAATAGLAAWVLFVLGTAFVICAMFGAAIVEHVEAMTTTKMFAPDGREVEYAELPPATPGGGASWRTVYKGTTQPAAEHRSVRTRDVPQNADDLRWRRRFLVGNLVGAAVLGLGSGMLVVVFLWHWRRRRYALVLLVPFVVAAATVGLFYAEDWDDEYVLLHTWVVTRALGYAAFTAAFLAVGLLLGRPVARGVLRMLLPPKVRQHFAFLWRIDGKTPPPATGAA